MSNDAPAITRLLAARYVPSTQRPQCSNCARHRVPMVLVTINQGLHCTLLDAAVSKLGMCQHYVETDSHTRAGLRPRGRGTKDPHWPLVRAAAAASPAGVTNAEVQKLCGIDAHSAGTKLSMMTHCGQLQGIKVPGACKHWFADEAAGLAWAAAHGAKLTAASRHVNPKRRQPGLPAPVTGTEWQPQQGEARPHTEIVHTIAKTPDFVHPYQQHKLPPDPRYPSFASLGPGKYDGVAA